MIQHIAIDCPPLSPRPDVHLRNILKGTALEVESNKEPDSKLFGNWLWTFEMDDDAWALIVNDIKPRLASLYNTGQIRYAEWSTSGFEEEMYAQTNNA